MTGRGVHILLTLLCVPLMLSPPHNPLADTVAGMAFGINLCALVLSFKRAA